MSESWEIKPSNNSKRTCNPIRAIVDRIKIPQNHSKKLIPLSIGDPACFGNLNPPQEAIDAVVEAAKQNKSNGYVPSTGTLEGRAAVAARFSTESAPVTAADVVLASGCSGAISIAIEAFCDEGDNFLIPRPGFSLYRTIAGHDNVEARYYNLLPEKQWEIDLDHLESLIDSKTKCILINNPSNPTGSNYSRQHLMAFLEVAAKHKLPVIADEIYADMVFEGETFYPLASVAYGSSDSSSSSMSSSSAISSVPIISVGGLAKQYLCPGWRLGWLIIYDGKNQQVQQQMKSVREGIISLSQLILGPCTLIQAALPSIFAKVPQSFYTQTNKTLETNAMLLTNKINERCPGLKVVKPQGAMYLMVEIDFSRFDSTCQSDTSFAQQLLEEQMLMVLPGSCFQAEKFFRLVCVAPEAMLEEAVSRMEEFVQKHIKKEKEEEKEQA